MKYWIVYSAFISIGTLTDIFLFWSVGTYTVQTHTTQADTIRLPFYDTFKFMFLLYLSVFRVSPLV